MNRAQQERVFFKGRPAGFKPGRFIHSLIEPVKPFWGVSISQIKKGDKEALRDFSFPKSERLLKPEEFAKVRKFGKRFSTRSLTLFVLPNELKRTRLGLSVSAKVGGAAVRNRAKRLLREFFRLNKKSFPDSSDILISVKTAEYLKFYRDVEEELRKAPFLKTTGA